MGKCAWILIAGAVAFACSGGANTNAEPGDGGAGGEKTQESAGTAGQPGVSGDAPTAGAGGERETTGGSGGEPNSGGAAGAQGDGGDGGGGTDDSAGWSSFCQQPTDGLDCAAKTWKFPVKCDVGKEPPALSCEPLIAPSETTKGAWCCSQCLRDRAFDYGSESPGCPKEKPHYQRCSPGTATGAACVAASIPSGGRCCAYDGP